MLLDIHLLPVGINSSKRLESATSKNYEYFRYECFVKQLFSPKKLKPIMFYTGTKHWPWCTSIYSVQNVTTRVYKFPQKINSLAIDHVVTLAAADGRTGTRMMEGRQVILRSHVECAGRRPTSSITHRQRYRRTCDRPTPRLIPVGQGQQCLTLLKL